MSEMQIHEEPLPAETEPAEIPEEQRPEAHPPEGPAEADRPRVGVIGLAIGATLVLLVIIVVGVNELFRQMMTSEIEGKVLSRPNSELRELRAEEEAKLGRYQWVSKKDGVVRVPLARAIELTLADYRARSARVDLPSGK